MGSRIHYIALVALILITSCKERTIICTLDCLRMFHRDLIPGWGQWIAKGNMHSVMVIREKEYSRIHTSPIQTVNSQLGIQRVSNQHQTYLVLPWSELETSMRLKC